MANVLLNKLLQNVLNVNFVALFALINTASSQFENRGIPRQWSLSPSARCKYIYRIIFYAEVFIFFFICWIGSSSFTVHRLSVGQRCMHRHIGWVWYVYSGKCVRCKTWHFGWTVRGRIWSMLCLYVWNEINVAILNTKNVQNIFFKVMASCGEVVRDNGTYFVNPNHPSQYEGTGSCQLTVLKLNPNICQIRLDLEHFSISGPEPLNHVCNTDQFLVSGGSPAPTICGTSHGEHSNVLWIFFCNRKLMSDFHECWWKMLQIYNNRKSAFGFRTYQPLLWLT